MAWVTTGAVMLAFAVLVPVAGASDASLLEAYRSHRKELRTAGEHYFKAVERLEKNGASDKEFRALIRADYEINSVLRKIAKAMRAEQASSDHGRRAKRNGLEAILRWRKANRFEITAARVRIHNREERARYWIRRAIRQFRRGMKAEKRARAAFRDAGLKPGQGIVGI